MPPFGAIRDFQIKKHPNYLLWDGLPARPYLERVGSPLHKIGEIIYWKSLSRRNLIYSLKQAGFDGSYSGGKHQYMLRGELKLTIPNQHQGDISQSLLSRILRQANISRDEWETL